MDDGREAEFVEDCVGMFLPQPRGLRVALHGREDRDDMSRWDGRATFVIFPPLVRCKSPVLLEGLQQRGCIHRIQILISSQQLGLHRTSKNWSGQHSWSRLC